jgi:DNA-binding response OmpR family regulator
MDPKLKIVLVEDNNDLRDLLSRALRREGHEVIPLSCAEELGDTAHTENADAFLLDINLPGEDGLSLMRRLRQIHPLNGIILLSARSELQDRLQGYEGGADLYLTKPIVMAELIAALGSFSRKRFATMQELSVREITLHKLDLKGDKGHTRVTAQEAMVLTALARAPANQLETWQFAELLESELNESFKSSLTIRIARLRKKLQEVGAQGSVIESLRNIGYQLTTQIKII